MKHFGILLSILCSDTSNSAAPQPKDGWVQIMSKKPASVAQKADDAAVGKILKDGNLVGLPWKSVTGKKETSGVMWLNLARGEAEEADIPRKQPSGSWADIVRGPTEKPSETVVPVLESSNPATRVHRLMAEEEDETTTTTESPVTTSTTEITTTTTTESPVTTTTTETTTSTTTTEIRTTSVSQPRDISSATVRATMLARLAVIRRDQIQGDVLNQRYALISAVFPGNQIETPLGRLLVLGTEPLNQLHRLTPRLAWKVQLDIMTASPPLIMKVGDISTDMNLVNEYTVLKLLEGTGIAPVARFLSPPRSKYTRSPRYLITEETGTPLHSFCAFNQPSPRQLVIIFLDALDLIERMHTVGVVHGNLNEFNLHVFPSGKLALSDFELASFLIETGRNPRSYYTDRVPQNNMVEFQSPWELNGGDYSRRDDLFRWIEMFARLLFGFEYIRFLQLCPLGMTKFKFKEPFFTFESASWLVLPFHTRGLAKRELGWALEYIRNLRFLDQPDYGFLTQRMETLLGFF
jgi:hypothetical protein